METWGLLPASLSPGSGFRVQGSGFRVQGSGFRVQGPVALIIVRESEQSRPRREPKAGRPIGN